jgi:hypothetical protein
MIRKEKKDLSVIVDHYEKTRKETILLENIILIDDSPSVKVAYQNFIHVPSERELKNDGILYVAGRLHEILTSELP